MGKAQSKAAQIREIQFQLPYSQENYERKIAKVKKHIGLGDTYQVNFTFRQKADFKDQPFDLFLHMAQGAPYAAYIENEDFAISSASPELFFQIKDGIITARPMKGTWARGRTLEEDLFFKNQLVNSQKDRSENVMIVDMIRNDMSKIAEIGTVKTPKLFDIEKYPTVWQMTSTVEGKTKASFSKILNAMFPCASITGAPKVSTMEIIRELEDSPRKIYTGSIGYLNPNGDMQFNVAIRTALINKKKKALEYGVGGGIVWKSEAKKEFEECILKSKVIRKSNQSTPFSLLETILWEPESGYFLLEKHLERIQDSANYFDFQIDLEKIKKQLAEITYFFGCQNYRVRVLLSKNGKLSIQYFSSVKNDYEKDRSIILANDPVDSNNPFLFHKTTNRKVYENRRANLKNYYDVLLWNEKRELTEFTKGNLVVKWNGALTTPSVSCGLLNGTFRSQLLAENILIEKVIPIDAIDEIEEWYFINSVRKWQQVEWKTNQNLLKSSLQNDHSGVRNSSPKFKEYHGLNPCSSKFFKI